MRTAKILNINTNICQVCFCRSDSVIQEIALGGLEKEDKELNQIDQAVFSKVSKLMLSISYILGLKIWDSSLGCSQQTFKLLGVSMKDAERPPKCPKHMLHAAMLSLTDGYKQFGMRKILASHPTGQRHQKQRHHIDSSSLLHAANKLKP